MCLGAQVRRIRPCRRKDPNRLPTFRAWYLQSAPERSVISGLDTHLPSPQSVRMRSTSPDNHHAVRFGVLGRLLAMLPIYEFLLIVAGFLLILGTAYGWIWYVGPTSSIPAGVRFRNHEMLDKDGNTLARWNKGSWVDVERPKKGRAGK